VSDFGFLAVRHFVLFYVKDKVALHYGLSDMFLVFIGGVFGMAKKLWVS